jgi:hypothetical protein
VIDRVEVVRVLLARGGVVTRGDVEALVERLDELQEELQQVRQDAEAVVTAAEAYADACLASSSIEAFEALPTVLEGWRKLYPPTN